MRQLDRQFRRAIFSLLLVSSISACSEKAVEQERLPSLGTSKVVTVSGISSGGYMAGQYQVAFSKQVAGAAIIAAGPWACARGDISRALQNCISGDGVDLGDLFTLAEEKAGNQSIDAMGNLADARLYFFRGSKDDVVGDAAVEGSLQWFANYAKPENIKVKYDVPAAHGWPTAEYGSDCEVFAAPYINNCAFDLAGELLSHLYADMEPPGPSTRNARRFDQRPFGDANLADFAYVYIPESCESASGCRVHIFFHGCEQSADSIGTELVDHAGLNRWAESNRIVVLYPQVEKSLAAPMNPLGCWDWWGYTGANYLERTGAQLNAVHKMAATLAGK